GEQAAPAGDRRGAGAWLVVRRHDDRRRLDAEREAARPLDDRAPARRLAGDGVSLRAQPGADQPARVGRVHRGGAGDAASRLGGARSLLRGRRVARRLLGAGAAPLGPGRGRRHRHRRGRQGDRARRDALRWRDRARAGQQRAAARADDRDPAGGLPPDERPLAVTMREVAAAIIAGGPARRLGGVAKPLLEVGGQAVADRQLAVLRPLFARVFVVANDPAPWAGRGVEVAADRVVGAGPLAGLAAALAAAGRAEPLCARYATDLRILAEARLQTGRFALHELLEATDTAWLDDAGLAPLDPEGLSFVNLNTPDDLRRAE